MALSHENEKKGIPAMKTTARITHPAGAVLVIALLLLPGLATAATIELNPVTQSLQQGSTTTLTLTLDSAPDGLAGYRMNLALSNPSSARVVGVSYPSWASINNTTGVPGSTVRISGVDLGRAVEKGSLSVPLATITLQGMGAGTCRVMVSDARFDADGGNVTLADPAEATLTVSGTIPTTSTSQGGSGGSSGGSSSGGGVSGGGSSSGFTGSIVEQKTPAITMTPSTAATMAVVSYAAPEGTVSIVPTPAEAANPGVAENAGSGLPLSPYLIGAGVLVLVAIVAFLILKRKS
jgi:uncharacterized membrane protein YgcG